MSEIGGYFEFEKLIDNEYHKELLKLNSACSALNYAILAYDINKIYLPYYLCDSVFEICRYCGVDLEFYHIDNSFKPIFDKSLKSGEFLYIVNYYSFLSNDDIIKYKMKYDNIVIDNVQSFFQRPVEHVITLYSCRKYFGVPDGAYLSIDRTLDNNFEYESAINSMTHLIGRLEENASKYYSCYKNNEKKFRNPQIKRMSKVAEILLGAIDYNSVIHQRNSNFNYLNNILKNSNRIDLSRFDICGPFCYPYFINNGAVLRQRLIENKIYIPTLWPNIKRVHGFEFEIKNNLLQIPCDHRMDIKDIKRMVRIICTD
jgi:hypothetical protein